MRLKKSSLLNDEYIIFKSNLTNYIYINEIFIVILVFMYLAYIYYIVKDFKIAIFCVLPLLFLSLFMYIKEMIKDLTTRIIITNKRVLGRVGFLKIKTLDTLISSIDNVQVEMSLIGRIFKYGTIIIESKSETYKYKLINNPNKLKKIIMNEASIIK